MKRRLYSQVILTTGIAPAGKNRDGAGIGFTSDMNWADTRTRRELLSIHSTPTAAALVIGPAAGAAMPGEGWIETELRRARDAAVACVERLEGRGPIQAGAKVTVENSSTGNLNFCFRVRDAVRPDCSVFVKLAPPFVRCLGPDHPLSAARIEVEAAAQRIFEELSPGGTAAVLSYDIEAAIMVMEDLPPPRWRLLQTALIEGDQKLEPAMAVARFMSTVHAGTRARVAELAPKFQNDDLCAITDKYVFTLPFDSAEPSNSHTPSIDGLVKRLRADEAFLAAVDTVHRRFRNQECLIHGDLHLGSVLTDGISSKVIDHEFAFVGPAAFDLGLFVAGYIFPYAAATARQNCAAVTKIEAIIEALVNCYFSEGSPSGRTWSDTVGFMGCELLRRVLGVAKRDDIEGIQDPNEKCRAETFVLELGKRAVLASAAQGQIAGSLADSAAALIAEMQQLAASG